MRKTIIALMSVAAMSAAPSLAMADEGGTVAGATSGAVAGAVVGGPVGAVVGGAAGAAIGNSATGPSRPDTVVVDRPAGCSTTSVRRENDLGESKTVTRTDC